MGRCAVRAVSIRSTRAMAGNSTRSCRWPRPRTRPRWTATTSGRPTGRRGRAPARRTRPAQALSTSTRCDPRAVPAPEVVRRAAAPRPASNRIARTHLVLCTPGSAGHDDPGREAVVEGEIDTVHPERQQGLAGRSPGSRQGDLLNAPAVCSDSTCAGARRRDAGARGEVAQPHAGPASGSSTSPRRRRSAARRCAAASPAGSPGRARRPSGRRKYQPPTVAGVARGRCRRLGGAVDREVVRPVAVVATAGQQQGRPSQPVDRLAGRQQRACQRDRLPPGPTRPAG